MPEIPVFSLTVPADLSLTSLPTKIGKKTEAAGFGVFIKQFPTI